MVFALSWIKLPITQVTLLLAKAFAGKLMLISMLLAKLTVVLLPGVIVVINKLLAVLRLIISPELLLMVKPVISPHVSFALLAFIFVIKSLIVIFGLLLVK